MSSTLHIGWAGGTATLLAPPMAWATFSLITTQYLGDIKADGIATMVLVFFWSVIITGAGVLLIAVPLVLALNRFIVGRAVPVFSLAALIGAALAWLLARQEGPVIDFTTLAALHIAFAALIFSVVGLYQTKRIHHA